jgi:CubicO group peptidase (beta-lactamase class C family)
MATGYLAHPFEDEPVAAPHPLLNCETAAGQLYSSVHDLARWLALQFRTRAEDGAWTSADGVGQVLAGSSLAEMHRPQYVETDLASGHAIAWFVQRRGERVYLGHGGSLPGFRSQILFNAQHRVGAIVLANGIGSPLDIAIELLELLIEGQAEGAEASVAPLAKPVATPPDWRCFLGRYVDALGADVQMRVECRGGSLFLATPPMSPAPVRLEPTDQPGVFTVESGRYAGEPLSFRLAPDGTVSGFVTSGFPYRKLVEVRE